PATDRTRGHVLAEAGGMVVAVERDRQEKPAVVGLERATERHREPALHIAATALGHQVAQLAAHAVVQLRRVEELDAVAGLLDASDRLAEALVRLALEAETAHVDDGLVADIEV